MCCAPEERSWLAASSASRPGTHWDRVLFCAKEATYKAWFPLTRRWLEFSDLEVTVRPDGTFRTRVAAAGPTGGIEPHVLRGRWLVARGLVLAAATPARWVTSP